MADDERAGFVQAIPNVSHETIQKLSTYEALLKEWDAKFNLVAPSTLPHIWSRHFLDSAQLAPLLPTDPCVIADMGSGAGFPALVLAIMTPHKIHLIESTGKKVNFLRAVITELGLSCEVHQERVEALIGLKADVVMARALKALPELLGYAKPLMKKGSVGIFPKGEKLDAELTEAAKWWTFKSEKIPSLSDPSGQILIVRDLQKKEPDHEPGRPRRRKK